MRNLLISISVVLLAACVKPISVPDQAQIALVVAYQNGEAVGGQILGLADNIKDCEKGLASVMPELKAKPGIALVPLCIPAPLAPPADAYARGTPAHSGERNI